MFLIDTNVISESRKVRSGRAAPEVVAWLKATNPGTTFISVITLFELELGVVRAERRDPAQGEILRRWLDHIVKPGFAGRVLAIDSTVAITCAGLQVPDPVSERDGWIAATALAQGLTVVTRNVADFAATGVAIHNPWSSD
ncbi:type II toxin-antitoxin system VapC family toxin (plasmid) [Sphingobium sp. V4]|uniref:type II toxin-antitoxin system VapC family toxin n=1 Tax=Sphingobium sp. V4 TaxID=3038927 RepID=UPI002557CBE0|nr:type II toxin-antitoxin system VapC family toxin [Sphingobium sp. V4]WIW91139.1 type II toxin-antitoxin system VapC family toxin [Sphingobium sp. V4]